MTHDKKFKAQVRARMDATGESYTAARAALEPRREELQGDGAMPLNETDDETRDKVLQDFAEELRAVSELKKRRSAAWPHTTTGDLDSRAAMTRLACLFPTLGDAAGVHPRNPEAFVAWTCGPAPGAGALEAARFVLQVWNWDEDWATFARENGIDGADILVPFNVVRAMARWDCAHQDAMLAWLRTPFFP